MANLTNLLYPIHSIYITTDKETKPVGVQTEILSGAFLKGRPDAGPPQTSTVYGSLNAIGKHTHGRSGDMHMLYPYAGSIALGTLNHTHDISHGHTTAPHTHSFSYPMVVTQYSGAALSTVRTGSISGYYTPVLYYWADEVTDTPVTFGQYVGTLPDTSNGLKISFEDNCINDTVSGITSIVGGESLPRYKKAYFYLVKAGE